MSRTTSIRRTLLAAALALTAAAAASGPAGAAVTDGTSNTVLFAEAVHIDPVHHQALVRAPAQTPPAGRRIAALTVRTPHHTLLLENTMISGLTSGGALSLNFAGFMDYTDDALIEPDGTYWLS
jgi:hypothetical protein